MADTDYAAEMRLPDGKTCADCHHVKLCVGIGCTKPESTSCDFHPSRFMVAKPDAPIPPHWLNPDAILGAVESPDDGPDPFAALGVDPEDKSVAFALPGPYPFIQWRDADTLTLRPDLWPVKPELAALFGEQNGVAVKTDTDLDRVNE